MNDILIVDDEKSLSDVPVIEHSPKILVKNLSNIEESINQVDKTVFKNESIDKIKQKRLMVFYLILDFAQLIMMIHQEALALMRLDHSICELI